MRMASPSLPSKEVVHVAKFHGLHFTKWKVQIFIVFEYYKVLGIVLGKEKQPGAIVVQDDGGVVISTDSNSVTI